MKLITEHNDDLQYFTEETKGQKKHFLEGIFMQSDVKNRNGRIYPRACLESAVNKYMTEQIATGRAVGELGHPDSPSINLDRVSHRITELKWDGNDVRGKAQVLETPMGKIVQGLMDGGVKLGVSSRGLGTVTEKNNTPYVNNDFILSTVDIVQDPSAPEAFVRQSIDESILWENGIMESVDWEMIDDKAMIATKKKIDETFNPNLHSEDRANRQIREFKNFMNLLKS